MTTPEDASRVGHPEVGPAERTSSGGGGQGTRDIRQLETELIEATARDDALREERIPPLRAELAALAGDARSDGTGDTGVGAGHDQESGDEGDDSGEQYRRALRQASVSMLEAGSEAELDQVRANLAGQIGEDAADQYVGWLQQKRQEYNQADPARRDEIVSEVGDSLQQLRELSQGDESIASDLQTLADPTTSAEVKKHAKENLIKKLWGFVKENKVKSAVIFIIFDLLTTGGALTALALAGPAFLLQVAALGSAKGGR